MTNVAIILAIAISIPNCVSVKKNTPGLIKGDAITKLIIAPRGAPSGINARANGTAAYVGKGDIIPSSAAIIIARNLLSKLSEICFYKIFYDY